MRGLGSGFVGEAFPFYVTSFLSPFLGVEFFDHEANCFEEIWLRVRILFFEDASCLLITQKVFLHTEKDAH